SPKTQSALLESMQEQHVTVLGTTHSLPHPFMVLATQNPIELEGTYPLPEAQLDRFLFKLSVKDVTAEVLTEIILKRGKGELPEMEPVLKHDELCSAMKAVDSLQISKPVASYIARLVKATHADSGNTAKHIKYGASPRAALSMAAAARARALLESRGTVGFEDVKAVALPALRHRIILDYSARLDGLNADSVLENIVASVLELDRDAPSNIIGGS
ncbi:MAG: MoxR family ATPase, partial [bacterium]|nr:MoxR family ATPase [bacterium]